MNTATVDINETSRQMLSELAEKTGQTIAEVLDKALIGYRRDVFFGRLNAGYAKLRAIPKDWAEHEAERKEWDAALMDGLEAEEHWTDENPPKEAPTHG